MAARARRRGGGRQPRRRPPTPSPTRPANDPYAITVGAVDDLGDEGHAGRQPRLLVEPRHHPGRLRQARHRRPGRAPRRPLAPGSDFASHVPRLRRRPAATSASAAPRWPPRSSPASRPTCSRSHPDMDARPGQGRAHVPRRRTRRDGEPDANMRPTADGQWEVAADKAVNATKRELRSNAGLVPELIPRSGHALHRSRARVVGPRKLEHRGRRPAGQLGSGELELRLRGLRRRHRLTRASWGRASWGRASWGASSATPPRTTASSAAARGEPNGAAVRRGT